MKTLAYLGGGGQGAMAPPKGQKGGAKVSYGPPQWQAKFWNAVDATTAESKLQKVWITVKCINVVLFSVKMGAQLSREYNWGEGGTAYWI